MKDGEDLHLAAPRMTFLVFDHQVVALVAKAGESGAHMHVDVPKPVVPDGPEMPDALPGQQWVTMCYGGKK